MKSDCMRFHNLFSSVARPSGCFKYRLRCASLPVSVVSSVGFRIKARIRAAYRFWVGSPKCALPELDLCARCTVCTHGCAWLGSHCRDNGNGSLIMRGKKKLKNRACCQGSQLVTSRTRHDFMDKAASKISEHAVLLPYHTLCPLTHLLFSLPPASYHPLFLVLPRRPFLRPFSLHLSPHRSAPFRVLRVASRGSPSPLGNTHRQRA